MLFYNMERGACVVTADLETVLPIIYAAFSRKGKVNAVTIARHTRCVCVCVSQL